MQHDTMAVVFYYYEVFTRDRTYRRPPARTPPKAPLLQHRYIYIDMAKSMPPGNTLSTKKTANARHLINPGQIGALKLGGVAAVGGGGGTFSNQAHV